MMKKSKMILCAALTGLFAVSGGVLALQTYEVRAANESTFKVEETAALRLSEPEGLRFRVSLSETEKTSFGENAEYGVLLLPEAMLGANELKFDANGQVAIADTLVIEARAWTEDSDDSIATYSCVLSAPTDENGQNTAFPAAYYNAPIVARGYVKDEEGTITYTENTATRSIGYIAKLCEVEGLTTAEATKDKYAGIATIAQGTQATLSVNDGQVLSTGKTYTPEFVVGGMDAASSPKAVISYESSNPDVINVEGDSLFANAGGTTTITAKIACNGSEAKAIASVDVTVKTDFASLRVGEDENTLFFFNQAAGEEQITEVGTAGMNYAYTKDKAYGDENGSLQVTFPGTAKQNTVNYDFADYAYTETDYAVFYIYNDTNTDLLELMFDYSNSLRLNKGEWTMVVRPISAIPYFRFMGQNAVAYPNYTQAEVSGSVYISKAKVYSADQIKALASVTTDWTVGNTTFTGKLSAYNNAVGVMPGTMNTELEVAPYLVNGELRQVIWNHSYPGFWANLKNSVDVSTENKYISITIKGAIADKFTILPMKDGAEWTPLSGSLAPIASEVVGDDGFVKYIFEVPATSGTALTGFRVTPLGARSGMANGQEIRIADITIGGFEILRTGEDKNTLFFFDNKVGESQIKSAKTATYTYTDEKAYGDESGSMKITFNGSAAHNFIALDFKNYNANEGDYVVFNVYNDTSTACINLLLGYYNGTRLNKGEWTTFIRPLADLDGKELNFYGLNYSSNSAYFSGGNVSGSVYLSEAKVYSADQVKALLNVNAEEEWSIGNTVFKGASIAYNSKPKKQATDANSDYLTTDAGGITDIYEYNPYLINGELRQVLWRHSYAGFYAALKTTVSISEETQYIAITAKGAVFDKFGLWVSGANDPFDLSISNVALNPTKTIEGEDGYVTYIFKVTQQAGMAIHGLRLVPVGNVGAATNFNAYELRICDVTIGNAGVMADMGYSLP